MIREAEIVQTEHGLQAASEGWFVMNLADVAWQTTERGGTWSLLETADAPFGQFGIGLHVLPPGESSGFYHWESDQEGFLVLAGDCLLVVEGQERPLRQWDYFHCPPGTAHMTVGAAGEAPCVLLMVGVRTKGGLTRYLVDAVAARHGVAVETEADNSRDAYAQWPVQPREFHTVKAPPMPGGAGAAPES
jgi:uncharacterized cupin superfamily protein